jgi:hypothetical protein
MSHRFLIVTSAIVASSRSRAATRGTGSFIRLEETAVYRRVDDMQLKCLGLLAISSFMASMLSACGGQQVTPSGAEVVPPAQGMSRMAPDFGQHNCNDANHHNVRITPCPIRPGLGPKQGITVTITGPNVVSGTFHNYAAYCDDHGNVRRCVVAVRVAPTQWLVYYKNCSGRSQQFSDAISGFAAHGRLVGKASLKIKGLDHVACENSRDPST